MKVYVSKLPKDCIECPFCQDIKVNAGMDRLLFCKANKGKAIKNIEKSFDKCIVKNEFQSLSDHDKQVRKEVCEEIRKWCDKNFNWVGDGTGYDGQDYNEMIGSNNTINKLREFLDQLQGEIKCLN